MKVTDSVFIFYNKLKSLGCIAVFLWNQTSLEHFENVSDVWSAPNNNNISANLEK